MLVESKPEAETTQPETRPAPTLPAFIQDSIHPTAPPETKPGPTQPAAEKTKPTEKENKPVITKQPTGETIQAGEEAWFVAKADGAQGVRWQFIDPEDQMPKSAELIATLYPDLKIQGLEKETLILSSLPESFSGWRLQAEFYNESGSAFSDPAPVTVTAPKHQNISYAYQPVIENCRYIQRFDPALGNPDGPGPEDIYNLYEGRDLLSGGLGYAMLDLNGDGIQELIIGCPGTNTFGEKGDNMIYALFTLAGDKPVKLLQSWARSRHYLTQDNAVYYEGSNSAYGTTSIVLRLDGTELTPRRSLWRDDPDAQGISHTYYAPKGNPAEKQEIPEYRYYEIQAEMIAKRKPLPELTVIPST